MFSNSLTISPSPQPSPYFPLNAGNRGEGVGTNLTKLSGSDKDVMTLTKMRGVHSVKLQ